MVLSNTCLNVLSTECVPKILNKILFEKILDILVSERKLQEFAYKNILIHLLKQMNDTDLYVFVGTKDKKLSKYQECITALNRQIIKLGNAVAVKFGVKNIKELYHANKFYIKKTDMNEKKIFTLMALSNTTDISQETIRNKVKQLLVNFEENIANIDTTLKTKLLDISIDESFDDNEFNFDNELFVAKNISDAKLAGILFEYLLSNIEDKDAIYPKLGELFINKNKKSGKKEDR